MGVVSPDHRLGVGATVFQQRAQGIEHVPVAQVPGRRRTSVNGAVVLLCGDDYTGILRGVEKSFIIADKP
ncbi:hypothetical protein D3C80_1753900 [compost metagenome]